jgi:hypothetical protein
MLDIQEINLLSYKTIDKFISYTTIVPISIKSKI